MKIYRPHEFAKHIRKSVSTLRRWDDAGTFKACRAPSGHRYYTEDHLRNYMGIQPTENSKVVVYCRVSSKNQMPDLKKQVTSMEEFCRGRGLSVDVWISEIGGGMNFKRPKFLSLMEQIREGEVRELVIAHKDRLCRFGFDFIQWFCEMHKVTLTVANQESVSPQQEMVEDLMTIVHTFSCRLYGLRRYSKKIREAATT